MRFTILVPILSVLLTFITFQLTAQIPNNFLTVYNPQTGLSAQGTIEEATFVARPEGIYMAVDVYLTISARGAFAPAQINPNHLLEARLDFEQQVNAFTYDYWVFDDDKIFKADHSERYIAEPMYNIGSVRDTNSHGVAILERGNAIKHSLRIFPLPINGTRRLKFSYLAIAAWSEERVTVPVSSGTGQQSSILQDTVSRGKFTAPLPAYIVYNGSRFLPKVEVRAFLRPEWGVPKLEEFPEKRFDLVNDTLLGNYYKTEVDITNSKNALNLTLQSPLKNGVYVSNYKKDSIGFYQVVLLPELMRDVYTPKPRKVMLVFDFKEGNTRDIFRSDLLNFTKAGVLNLFRPTDSLNIAYYTRLNARTVRNQWVAATPENMDAVYEEVNTDWAPGSSSNLPSVIGEAIDFFNDTNSEGDICIFSNTGEINSGQVNSIIQDIQAAIGQKKINIHVYDSQNENFSGNNSHFFTLLTQRTFGNYTNTQASNPAYNVNINTALESGLAIDGFTNIQVSLANGITYDLYNLKNELSQITKFNEPIFQMGKFEGSGPFELQISGKVESDIFARRIQSEVFSLDSVAQETWAGTHIIALEKIGQTQQALQKSLQERVLVNQTAFVIGNSSVPCERCIDETKKNTTATAEVPLLNYLNINAAPNPFRNEIKLSLSLPEARSWSNYHFGIYNLNGQLLQSFQNERNTHTNQLEFIWKPNNITPGMYLFIIQSPEGQRSQKLIKL